MNSRKAQKPRPKLPLSVFTHSNTGTSEVVTPVPSPSSIHPVTVIDANVITLHGDPCLTQWKKKEVGEVLGARLDGVVLSLPGANLEEIIDQRVSTYRWTRYPTETPILGCCQVRPIPRSSHFLCPSSCKIRNTRSHHICLPRLY